MEFEEFEASLTAVRAARESRNLPEGFQLFDLRVASEADLQHVERELHVSLPGKYREFMLRHGGGQFLFLDLLPASSGDSYEEDLIRVNGGGLDSSRFIAVSPVGTGDWWGFSVVDGNCLDQVDFMDHEDGSISFAYPDFLEFLSRKGLQVE
ncbi:SMI1/KNR4 family protein [Streptomyces sp. NPDC050523]|uniref:SMI1/KNR4 family protein n=1 Tax=Streptomyces sp. NPDC050523 TaxID=3365622 RepID=UPI003789BDEA